MIYNSTKESIGDHIVGAKFQRKKYMIRWFVLQLMGGHYFDQDAHAHFGEIMILS